MSDVRTDTDTFDVTIDGQLVEARKGELIIEAAERAGIFIPRFCYHPRMEPVGMCRMCLVEVSGPRGFSLQPSCYIKVAPEQEVRTSSDKAKKAQEGVLEFLLVNHPLDCPVCDKGGECPLQDQSFSYGPGESRFVEEKRHWEKPIALSALVELDRERCIQCARCTRFADEIAGEALIDFAYRGDKVEVATFPDRPFSSYFSGNTVQICPVGALTARPYRFKSRPWDLEQVETTCSTCAVGCRVAAQSSAGTLVRLLGIDVDPVNQSWLCDKGRFAIEAVHSEKRLSVPLVRREGEVTECSWSEALSEVVAAIRWGLERGGPGQIGVVGGARLSNEDAYAWAKLSKSVLRTDSVDAQLGDGLSASTLFALRRATIDELSNATLVISLAPDLREELPVLFLRLRAGLVRGATKLIECSAIPSSLTKHATSHLSYLPGELARLCAALVSNEAAELTGVESSVLDAARALVAEHATNGRIVVVVGRASIAESAESVEAAVAVLADALSDASFLSTLRRSNVHGALDMGLAPGTLPGRVSLEAGRALVAPHWEATPEGRGRDTAAMLRAAADGELTTLFLLGADPLRDFPDRALAKAALERTPFVCSIGTHPDASSSEAHVVLPIAGDGERSGSFTNLEGRVSRLAEKVVPPGVSWPAWVVAAEIAARLGSDLGFSTLEELQEEIATVASAYRGLRPDVLASDAARDGVVVPIRPVAVEIETAPPRPIDPIATPGIASVESQGAPMSVGSTQDEQTSRPIDESTAPSDAPVPLRVPGELPVAGRLDSYSLRLVARRTLYDDGTLVHHSPSLHQLVAPPRCRIHPHELARLGLSSGDLVRMKSASGEIVIEALSDDTISRNVVVATTNVVTGSAGGIEELIETSRHGIDVRLETVDG